MTRACTRSLALLAAASLLGLWLTAPAAAVEHEDHGWWWRAQTGATELPPPPFVPENGLAVANDVEGPAAVAAVRFDVGDDDVSTATLELTVASEQGGELAEIVACPPRAGWSGAEAGAWDERPEPDCDAAQAVGTRNEEAETWTFDVGALAGDEVLDVVLVPHVEDDGGGEEAPAPGIPEPEGDDRGGQGGPFQVSFEPPSDDSLDTGGFGGDDFGGDDFGGDDFGDAAEEEGAGPMPGADAGAREEADRPGIADASPLDAAPAGGDEGPREDPEGAPAPDVAEPAEAAEEGEEVALVPPEEDVAQAPMATEPVGFGDDWGRQAAALVALLAAVAAAMLWRGPGGVPGVRGLSRSLIVRPEVARMLAWSPGGDGEAVGGLGRFARARSGEPPPL